MVALSCHLYHSAMVLQPSEPRVQTGIPDPVQAKGSAPLYSLVVFPYTSTAASSAHELLEDQDTALHGLTFRTSLCCSKTSPEAAAWMPPYACWQKTGTGQQDLPGYLLAWLQHYTRCHPPLTRRCPRHTSPLSSGNLGHKSSCTGRGQMGERSVGSE